MAPSQEVLVPIETIVQAIFVARGRKVILDSDLARLYGVTTARLNQQARRNIERFPEDFMFELTKGEVADLILHFATSRSGWGGRRKAPLVFTEHGALMAASVLSTRRAVEISVYVVRAFVELRETLAAHVDLARKLEDMERRLQSDIRDHSGQIDVHSEQIGALIEAIQELMSPPEAPERRIGFRVEGD